MRLVHVYEYVHLRCLLHPRRKPFVRSVFDVSHTRLLSWVSRCYGFMSQPAPTAFSSPFAHLVHDMETLELLTTVTNSIRYQYYRQTSSLCIDLQWEGATCY